MEAALSLTQEDFILYPEDRERYWPELNLDPSHIVDGAKTYLELCRKNLDTLMEHRCSAESIVLLNTLMIDRLLVQLFELCEKEVLIKTQHLGERATLVALGGYGRQEMNFHSDIDLLFVYPKKKGAYIESLTEKILYILWDLGLEVGYATRTISECKKGMNDDVTIMTALLDARYLAGNKKLSELLIAEIARHVKSGGHREKFIKQKIEERKARILKQGDSVFVLEPNVRDARGGLRDLQLPLWISKLQAKLASFEELRDRGLMRPEEYESLIQGRRFLWRLRNQLHRLVGKKVDVLTFDRQEKIANQMGYADQEGIRDVEQLMQDYYRHTNQVALITEMITRRMTRKKTFLRLVRRFRSKKHDSLFRLIDDQIMVRKKDLFVKNPIALLRLFEAVQTTGATLHPETKDLVVMNIGLVNDALRQDPAGWEIFRGMLSRYENLGSTLFAMHEVHFLEEWLPEFKKLVCRVQHDAYHFYTTDTHSIFAVNEVSRLASGDYGDKFPTFLMALKEIEKPELLTLGVFLHDIGKGEGGNHSVKGAVIGNHLTSRLGYSEADQKTVEFLVLSHLLMPHLSQRRDLEDQEMIIQFARSMGSLDNLNMLFVLTWADIRAVGPNAWTDWKGSLLEKLYLKTREVIIKGDFSPEKTLERVARIKDELIQKNAAKFDRDEFGRFLKKMPPRYFFAETSESIEWHYVSLKDQKAESFSFHSRNQSGELMTVLLVQTINYPKVFSQVAGVMSTLGINILKVDLFQATDGQLLLVLGVTNSQGLPITSADKLKQIEETLKDVLYRKQKISDLIEKRKVPDYLVKRPLQRATAKVVIDNDVSAYYTVIDVYAHDRIGLLYEITDVLEKQGCYVEVSKISTKVEQVSDVFYVKDIFGKKISSPEKIKSLKAELLQIVKRGEEV